jgi:hypothetical protein
MAPQQQGPPNYPGVGRRDLNPPFDSRLTSTGGANPALKDRPLKRGRFIRAPGDATQDPAEGLQLNFMFNPTELTTSFAYDQSMPDAAKTAFANSHEDVPTAPLIGEGSIQVSLLFDRTYEVWDRQNTVAGQFGVHADVLAFYAFLSMIEPTYDVNTSWENLYPKNQFNAKYAYLYVGDRLKFFGYVTSLAVQYVHWSYDMIPTRAAMDVGFNVILTRPGDIVTEQDINPFPKFGQDLLDVLPKRSTQPGQGKAFVPGQGYQR